MTPEGLVAVNPQWYSAFSIIAILNLTALVVWVMQSLVNSKAMVLTVLLTGIATGIAKLYDPFAHRVLAIILLVLMVGFAVAVTVKTWPRIRWAALANAVLLPLTALSGYLLFIG